MFSQLLLPAMAALFVTTALPAFCAPNYAKIVGNWKSNYGPVHVDLVSVPDKAGSANLKGQWLEGKGKKGEITSAHYDAMSGQLKVKFIETWSKHTGEATLNLDKSGKKFTGTFKSDDGNSGTWTWTRK